MPLPSFLQRFRPGTPGATPQSPLSPVDIEAARVKARRRMIGMAVLVAAGVLGFPLLFETQPRPLATDVVVRSAGQPQAVAVLRPQAQPQSRPVTGQVMQPVPEPAEVVEPPEPAVPASARAAGASARDETLAKAEARALEEARAKADARAREEAKARDEARAREQAKAKEDAKAKEEARARAALKGETGKAAAKVEEGTRYIVQVGAFSENDAARTARLKVEKLGITTYTQVVDTPAGKKIRVRVGPFTSKAEADKALDKLKKAGLGGNLLTL